MANPLYGQNKQDIKFGQVNLSNEYLQNKLAYSSWNWNDLSLRLAADVTDAKARAGITLVDGDICECLVDGGTGASATTTQFTFTTGFVPLDPVNNSFYCCEALIFTCPLVY